MVDLNGEDPPVDAGVIVLGDSSGEGGIEALDAILENIGEAQEDGEAQPAPFEIQARDIAETALFLASDEARAITGQAIVVDGEAVGSISLTLGSDVYRRSAELGYWLGEPFWGRGIMTAVVTAMCREGFGTWDIVRIHAEPFARNAASRRVLEKAGFTLEGTLRQSVYKNGEMLDSCIYALLREEMP